MRGIRGATTIETDVKENVLSATQELLEKIFASNPDLKTEDIASAIFTVTQDIISVFPAACCASNGLGSGSNDVRSGNPGPG